MDTEQSSATQKVGVLFAFFPLLQIQRCGIVTRLLSYFLASPSLYFFAQKSIPESFDKKDAPTLDGTMG